jgi:hypothetical protein
MYDELDIDFKSTRLKGTKAQGPVDREWDIKTPGLLQRTTIGSDQFTIKLLPHFLTSETHCPIQAESLSSLS